MTGLQLASFWEGNRAQLFATHVLSSVAAVVPVPVPMDFGHDLLCTLTRHENHALYAGAAFAVQVKSASDPQVHYGGLDKKGRWKPYEIDWLFAQHQPLIVAIVDLKAWTVNYYSTETMWWIPNQIGTPGEVVLVPDLSLDYFQETEGWSLTNRFRATPIEGISDGSTPGNGLSYEIPLGPPIVSVSVKEQEAVEFRNQMRQCMDAWLALGYRNLTHRRLHVPYVEEFPSWATNEHPGDVGRLWHFFSNVADQNIREILNSIAPAVGSLMHNLNHQQQLEKLDLVRPLARLLHQYGLLDGALGNFLPSETPQSPVETDGDTQV